MLLLLGFLLLFSVSGRPVLERCSESGSGKCRPVHDFSAKIESHPDFPGDVSCAHITRKSHPEHEKDLKRLRLIGIDVIVGKDSVIPVPLTHPNVKLGEESPDGVDVCFPGLVGKNLQSQVTFTFVAKTEEPTLNPVFSTARRLSSTRGCPMRHKVTLERGICTEECFFPQWAVIVVLVVSAVALVLSLICLIFIF